MKNRSGRTLVTGGAQRLGAEICRTLAADGHSIVVHYRQSENEALKVIQDCQAYGVKAQGIQGDFSTHESTLDFIQRYMQEFPDTQNLVNNVGNYLVQSAFSTSVEEYQQLFQINLFAPIALSNALIPALRKHQGCIVNIGIAGLLTDRADIYSPAYTMTKKCLWQLTKSLALELASEGVKVNMVSPGYIENAVDLPDPKKLPMRRPATEHEIARMVAFLLQKESEYITGQNIEIAGGVRLGIV